MPGRSFSSGDYRFGFNGMEKDDDVKGGGNSYTTELRILDTRLGKWLSLDPMMAKFPWQSPYATFDNNPVSIIDPSGGEGDDWYEGKNGQLIWKDSKEKTITVDGETYQNVGETKTGRTPEGYGFSAHADGTVEFSLPDVFVFEKYPNVPPIAYIIKDVGYKGCGHCAENGNAIGDAGQKAVAIALAAPALLPIIVEGGPFIQGLRDMYAAWRIYERAKKLPVPHSKFKGFDWKKASSSQIQAWSKAFERAFLEGRVTKLTTKQAKEFMQVLDKKGIPYRIDRGHAPPNPWQMDHINVGGQKQPPHIPFGD